MVKGKDSQLSGCGFESRRRILDGVSEASYYIGKRNKGSHMGQTKKKIKKKKNTLIYFFEMKNYPNLIFKFFCKIINMTNKQFT